MNDIKKLQAQAAYYWAVAMQYKEGSGSIVTSLLDSVVRFSIPACLGTAAEALAQARNVEILGTMVNPTQMLALTGVLFGLKALLPRIRDSQLNNLDKTNAKITTDALVDALHNYREDDFEQTQRLMQTINEWEQKHSGHAQNVYRSLIPSLLDFAVGTGFAWLLCGVPGLVIAAGVISFKKWILPWLWVDTSELKRQELRSLLPQVTNAAQECANHIDDINLAQMSEYEKGKSKAGFDRVRQLIKELSEMDVSKKSIVEILIGGIGIGLCLMIANGGFIASEITQLIFLYMYTERTINNIDRVENDFKAFVESRKFIQDMRIILNQQNTNRPSLNLTNAELIIGGAPTIDFENVRFSFPEAGAPTVLDNFNLNIPGGSLAALVGSSGAGKTTLVKLLCGFYLVSSGHIKINGIDVRDIPKNILWTAIGYCKKDFYLKGTQSILYNVLYDNRNRSLLEKLENNQNNFLPAEQEVIAQAADVLHEVDLNYDYMTKKCSTLSGGEKQRVSLARVLLKKSSIFVFDEPTANLDATTEAKTMNKIKEETKGRTTIIIAHHLNTTRNAETICFFDKIMPSDTCNTYTSSEVGSHDELMERDGRYAANYHLLYG